MSWKIDKELMQKSTELFLESLGDKAIDEVKEVTPRRVLEVWSEMLKGYKIDDSKLYKTFPAETKNLILIKDIEFTSNCEHHLMPFLGVVHIGYVPGDGILGLDRFTRIVNCFSRRLQIQERMTTEIGSSIVKYLKPKDLFVIVKSKHSCVFCRGVRQLSQSATTFFTYGKFENYNEYDIIKLIDTRYTNFHN
jgi:GTP cyclohydrolase I